MVDGVSVDPNRRRRLHPYFLMSLNGHDWTGFFQVVWILERWRGDRSCDLPASFQREDYWLRISMVFRTAVFRFEVQGTL